MLTFFTDSLIPLLPCPPSSIRLSEDIEKFTDWISLTPVETVARAIAIDEIKKVVDITFGGKASVHVFGSFPSGLSLPTSDIDLVVMTGNSPGSGSLPSLMKLAGRLTNPFYEKEVISHARVRELLY